jgi:hypothetical protein
MPKKKKSWAWAKPYAKMAKKSRQEARKRERDWPWWGSKKRKGKS